ncbi:MAG TPA: CvpA family protein [Xanthomonadaceae bacterium]|nr:CvpA family protein [Xanthomonadaceae bacterium]
MNATDLLLLGVILVSTLLGLLRGFVGAVVSLLAWLLAGWAAFHFGAKLALLLAGSDAPGAGVLLAGYGLCFLGVLVVVGVAGWLVRKLVKAAGLSGADRALGGALGFARGGFVACVLVLLLGFTALPREPGWQQSRVVPVLLPGAQWLRGWLPGWAAQRVDFTGDGPHSIELGGASAPPPAGAQAPGI